MRPIQQDKTSTVATTTMMTNYRHMILLKNSNYHYDDYDSNGYRSKFQRDNNDHHYQRSSSFRTILGLTVLGFLVWNVYISMNLSASVEDLTHTLPTELALAVERGITNSFFHTGGMNRTLSLSMSSTSSVDGYFVDVGGTARTPTVTGTSGVSYNQDRTKTTTTATTATLSSPTSTADIVSMVTPLLNDTESSYPQKLQVKLDRLYFNNNGRFYNPEMDGMLWHISDYVPTWMKRYFDWHTTERHRLQAAINQIKRDDPLVSDTALWNQLTSDQHKVVDTPFKFMIMQCIGGQDRQCGGTADRLKLFLYWVQQAAESNRLLLIYWTTPGRLEEFMVPPMGGIDWRIPEFLQPILHNKDHGLLFTGAKTYVYHPNIENLSTALIRLRVQSQTGLEMYYNDRDEVYSRRRVKTANEPNEFTFAEVYHDVFRIFFRPSLGVEQRIREVLGYPSITTPLQPVEEQPYLIPGQFAGIHVRSLYARETVDRRIAEETSINGLKCGSNLRPGGPFFMASDHQYVITAAENYMVSRNLLDTKVLVRADDESTEDPLHIAKATNLKERQPSEFYDTFVDLWILGMSECLVYNTGGFGTLGLLIGYDSKCAFDQKSKHRGPKARCRKFKRANEAQKTVNNKIYTHLPPLFVDPMA